MFGSDFRVRIVLFLVVLVLLAALAAQTQAQPIINTTPVAPLNGDDGPNLVTNEGILPPSSASPSMPVVSSAYPASNEGAPIPGSENSPFTSAWSSFPSSDEGALQKGNGLMKNAVTNEIIAP